MVIQNQRKCWAVCAHSRSSSCRSRSGWTPDGTSPLKDVSETGHENARSIWFNIPNNLKMFIVLKSVAYSGVNSGGH